MTRQDKLGKTLDQLRLETNVSDIIDSVIADLQLDGMRERNRVRKALKNGIPTGQWYVSAKGYRGSGNRLK